VYVSVSTYSDLEAQLCRLWGSAVSIASSTASSSTSPAHLPTLDPSAFTLYYVPPGYAANAPFSDWFHVRQKVGNDGELQRYLFSFPAHARHTLLLWQPCITADPAASCSAAAAATPAKVSPTKDQAPVVSLLSSPGAGSDAGSTASPRSRSSAGSRDSSVQADFASGVRMRDGAQCIVCNDPNVFSVELQAAHVVPLKGDRSDQWQAAGLSSPNDTRNGLVLCVSCHFFFDEGLWCIDPIDRCSMLVTAALAARRSEWSTRHGQAVRHATPFHPDWPTQQTLQVQFDFMQSHTAERHAEQARKKFECPYCGRRYASGTSVYLTRHVREHAAANEPIGHWTVFHTPAKKK
jgi:5-methylcytosine-specific restriction endonuclease McrA